MTAARTVAETDRHTETLRWLNIAVRTAHIGAAAMLFGCAMTPQSTGDATFWGHLVLVTGSVLLALEWLRDRRWPHRATGLLTLAHVGLFLVLCVYPGWTLALLWAILVVGSVCSHMPGRYRHWSILHGWEGRENESQTGSARSDAGEANFRRGK